MQESFSLNALDIVALIVVGMGMYKGYKKGILLAFLGVLGVLLALVLGIRFSYVFRSFFAERLDLQPEYITLMSFAVVFVLVLMLLTFVFRFLDDLLTKIHLGGVTKSFGALFGGYIAAIGLSVLLMVLSQINIPSKRSVEDSLLYPYLRTFAVDNAKLALRSLPVAKDALTQVDNVVRDKVPQGGGQTPAGEVPSMKPAPIR